MAVEDRFTVFVRLPFQRGDFVDPPQVDWSAAKERELWAVISQSSKGHEIDWKTLSQQLKVSQAFLLQQAAWLYERQLSQVRAQMKRMGSKSSNTASPAPPSGAASVVDSQPMRRTGSGGSRVPSRLSTQVPINESSETTTPMRSKSSFSRSSQQNVQQTPDSRPLSRRASRDMETTSRAQSRRGSIQQQIAKSPKQDVVHELESSEEEMTQSRMLHRRPNPAAPRRTVAARKPQHTRRPSAPQLNEEDEDDSPAFLPFSNNSSETAKASLIHQQSTITSRSVVTSSRPSANRRSTSERVIPQPNLASSNSSASERQNSTNLRQSGRGHLPTPLSPHQQAALATAAGLSPRIRRANDRVGHGSDTSPSMGSSFSDLDDASVTQSALEEALLSGMGNTTMTVAGTTSAGTGLSGNVANRVSGISQALRSRYFDASQK